MAPAEDDDDVSEISLSDDESAPVKPAPAQPSSAQQSSNSGRKSKPAAAGSGSSSSHGHGIRNGKQQQRQQQHGHRHERRNGRHRPADEPLYEQDEEEEEQSSLAGERYADVEGEDEGDEDEDVRAHDYDDRFEDEALGYIYSRRRAGAAPRSWLEVDEGEIKEVADSLLQNINRAYQSENVLQQIFASSIAAEGAELADSLGMGTIDPLTMQLAKGTRRDTTERHTVVNNKWHRGKRSAKQASEGGEETAAEPSTSTMSALPPEVSPSHDSFDPELYLVTFHADSSLKQLREGMRHLDAELSERTGQLKELINSNFERFISCKGTIDDVYLKLHTIQSSDHTGSTEELQDAIEQVQDTAQSTFGDVLKRAAETDRIKSVNNLLRRFNNLFGMPSRIRTLAMEGDLEQIVREYRRANALIKPSASTPNVWVSLYQEIEKSVVAVYNQARQHLQSLSAPVTEVPALIVSLAELAAQKLPGTREEDPMKLFLQCVEDHLLQYMQFCDASLDTELAELSAASRKMYHKQSTFAMSRSASSGPSMSAMAAAAVAAVATGSTDLASGLSGTGQGLVGSMLELLGDMSQKRQGVEDDEAFAAGIGPSSQQLLLWGGPPDWAPKEQSKDGALPPHLAEAMRVRLSAARQGAAAAEAASAAAASRGPGAGPGGGLPSPRQVPGSWDAAAPAQLGFRRATLTSSALLAAVAPHFTPVQFAWVRAVSRMSAEVCHALPAVWSVCTSPRLTQSRPDLSGASRKSIERAATLGRELIGRMVTELVDRGEDALQELQHAGPMQPCMELVIVDLAHAWHTLHDAGCPADSLEPLTMCLFKGLGLYTRSIAALLLHSPRALLREENWRVGAATRDSLPATQLPSHLQALAVTAMRSYSSVLQITAQLAPPPAEVTWTLLQEGLFGAVQTFCSCAVQMADEVEGSGHGADAVHIPARSRGSRRKGARRGAAELQVANGSAHQNEEPKGEEHDGGGTMPPVQGSGSALANGTAAGTAEAHAALPQHHEGAVKLLACMSNAIALRTKVVPLLVELHRHLLSGQEKQGERQLQQRLQTSGTQLEQLVSTLLATYLRLKQGQLVAAIQLYLARPVPNAGRAAGTRQALSQATPPTSPVSSTSPSLRFLMAILYSTYAEVFSHAALMLQPVMTSLASVAMATLAEKYGSLHSEGLELEQLLQLFLDLSYLEKALERMMTQGKEPGAGPDAEAAYLSLGTMMLQVVSQKGYKPKSAMARVLVGITDVKQAVARAHAMCRDIVRTLVQRSSVNLKCFS